MWKRLPIVLSVAAVSTLAVAACAPSSATWQPQAYPAVQTDGYSAPTGPHDIRIAVEAPTGTYEADGYIDLTTDGQCALDLQYTEQSTDFAPSTGRIVKPLDGPAYQQATGTSGWEDTRKPTAEIIPTVLIVNPLGVALSANVDTASWCFLTALPSITNLDDSVAGGQQYRWNSDALDTYVLAEGHTFVSELLDRQPLSGPERDVAAQRLAEMTSTEAHFVQAANPLVVREDGGATVLSYGLGTSTTVTITFTPTERRDIVTPDGAAPWGFDLTEIALP